MYSCSTVELWYRQEWTLQFNVVSAVLLLTIHLGTRPNQGYWTSERSAHTSHAHTHTHTYTCTHTHAHTHTYTHTCTHTHRHPLPTPSLHPNFVSDIPHLWSGDDDAYESAFIRSQAFHGLLQLLRKVHGATPNVHHCEISRQRKVNLFLSFRQKDCMR